MALDPRARAMVGRAGVRGGGGGAGGVVSPGPTMMTAEDMERIVHGN
ncbi:unnamed protein product [Ectocarpus sp. 12 AP-2014]